MPEIFPPTFFMLLIIPFKFSFLVFLLSTTIIVESTNLDITIESVTIDDGGPSTITKSHIDDNSSNNDFIESESNSSDGFGGIEPAGNRNKFSIFVSCKYFDMYLSLSSTPLQYPER